MHQTWYAVAEYTRLSLVELKDLLRHTKQNHAHDKSNQPTKGNSREFISGARTNFRKLYLWAQITETEFNKRVLLLRFRCWGRKSLQLNLPKEQKKKAPRKKRGQWGGWICRNPPCRDEQKNVTHIQVCVAWFLLDLSFTSGSGVLFNASKLNGKNGGSALRNTHKMTLARYIAR